MQKLTPPLAPKVPHEITQHGEKRVDNYFWMKDKNWQKIVAGDLDFDNPAVLEYIKAENAYQESVMEPTKPLQKKIYNEILSRIKEDDDTVPMKYGEYYYYSRTEKGKEYQILCRKKGPAGPEEIYFDVNKEASAHKLFKLGLASPSPNNKLLCYAFNLSGSMNYSFKIRNLDSGKDFDFQINDTTGSVEWANDNQHLIYTKRHPQNGRGYEIRRINISTGPTSDTLIFTKPKHLEELFMSCGKTSSDKYFLVSMSDTSTSETHFFSADDMSDAPKLIEAAQPKMEYDVEHWGDDFYLRTNADEATNFKIVSCPVSSPGKSNWKDYIAHDPKKMIDSFCMYKSHMVRTMTLNEKALQKLVVKEMKTGKETAVEMAQSAYYLSSLGAREFDTDTIQISYQSPVQPRQTIELNLSTCTQKVLKTQDVPNFNPSDYQVERVFAPAHDGEEIPITIVYKKSTPLNGTAPAFVYAYGSYGIGMPAGFSPGLFSLVDRGFIYATAHVRGGDDKGRDWYLNGKLMNKLNTFKDFISCTEYLISKKYAAQDKVAANGGSAGGMLMGGIANMRPDLFRAIVADVAFVDVINTISDTTLPLTEPEWNEWGNPVKSKEAYQYMMSYSPYDNVVAKNYPNMLFNSGISDEQVTYWEPTKMVAKMRELKTDNNLLLLKMKMHAGHSGASKRYEAIEERAFDFAFVLKCMGITE